jgi:hypothetical protein
MHLEWPLRSSLLGLAPNSDERMDLMSNLGGRYPARLVRTNP